MKKYLAILPLVVVITACGGFKTTVQRSMMTSTAFAHTGMSVWAPYYDAKRAEPGQPEGNIIHLDAARAQIDDSSRKFAATVTILDNQVAAYDTNKT